MIVILIIIIIILTLDCPSSSVWTLHERMLPKSEKRSKSVRLSTVGSRFFTTTLPTPERRFEGSRST
jgi:hypothetical protein